MKFDLLIQNVREVDLHFQSTVAKAVNRALTLRNWLIGMHIAEYEQQGADRAEYGEQLLNILAQKLDTKGLSVTNLKLNRQFYLCYPQIGQTASDQSALPQAISQTLSDQWRKRLAAHKEKTEQGTSLEVSAEKLISNLSFSHFTELIKVDDALKRTFYEVESIKGTWSVRELKRQINSLYFERSGLSKQPDQLSVKVQEQIAPKAPADILKNVYTFEFLGLPAKALVEESDLETALIDYLQEFILELGNGFCFEARQKRILIGDEYFFIDMVFYHRVLKCHVLIDLKVAAFSHLNAGQLNTYINYYNKHIKLPDDNPAIGLLLVTDKNKALVEYATAGMDEKLFIQKYLIDLPSKAVLEDYLNKELENI